MQFMIMMIPEVYRDNKKLDKKRIASPIRVAHHDGELTW